MCLFLCAQYCAGNCSLCVPIFTTFDPTYSATWYVSLSLNAPKIHFFSTSHSRVLLSALCLLHRQIAFRRCVSISTGKQLWFDARGKYVYSVFLLKTNAKRTETKKIRLWNWERIYASPTDVPSTASRLWHYFIYFVFFFSFRPFLHDSMLSLLTCCVK